MAENRFNLIDEPWIPIADSGKVSLQQVFSNPNYRSLGGDPVQKIALTKLLLAIAQAASTPQDNGQWQVLGAQGLAKACLTYLEKWRDCFYLYGDKPFLQIPAISKAEIKDYALAQAEISTGNTTVLIQTQIQRPLDDAEKALLLVSQMAFALGGKKPDNSVVLTPGYQGKTNPKGKPASSKPGSAVAHMGLLHNFFMGDTLQKTLWLNLFTTEQIASNTMFTQGLGVAPWEQMPQGEDCPVAKALKASLQGRLVPLCRFCLLTEQGMHYSEGIFHQNYKEGILDPTVAVNYSGKEPKALWVDPEKRPWRELTSLLQFSILGKAQGFESWQINTGLARIRDATPLFALYSGGLRVSSNAGEQYVSGTNDFVESQFWLHSDSLGEPWFDQLKIEMDALDKLSRNLYGCVMGYYKDYTAEGAGFAAQATLLFWQLCERNFQQLLDHCDPGQTNRDQRQQLRQRFSNYIHQAYNQHCPDQTARQQQYWAKCRPNNSKYLKQEA